MALVAHLGNTDRSCGLTSCIQASCRVSRDGQGYRLYRRSRPIPAVRFLPWLPTPTLRRSSKHSSRLGRLLLPNASFAPRIFQATASLFITDFFHPVDILAVNEFLNGAPGT